MSPGKDKHFAFDERQEIDGSSDIRETTYRTASKTSSGHSREDSDDEKVLSSDDDEPFGFGTQLRLARPMSYPCSLNFRP